MKNRLNQWLFKKHLDDDESVILVVHKHWMRGLKFMFLPTASFLACWVLLYYVPFRVIFFIASGWAVVSLVWWMRNFFDYYLDAWIITETSIIDVAWHGWFHRQSSRILYSDIQGVSYEINGVVNTMLRFGTISVEKISTGNAISIDNVPSPRKIEHVIMHQMETYLHSKNLKDSRHVQDIIAGIVARDGQLADFPSKQTSENNDEEEVVVYEYVEDDDLEDDYDIE